MNSSRDLAWRREERNVGREKKTGCEKRSRAKGRKSVSRTREARESESAGCCVQQVRERRGNKRFEECNICIWIVSVARKRRWCQRIRVARHDS